MLDDIKILIDIVNLPKQCDDFHVDKCAFQNRFNSDFSTFSNKAGYTANEVACGWAGAIFEVTRPFGQEQGGQSNKIIKKSRKSVRDFVRLLSSTLF